MASMVAYKVISELGPMTAAELAEQLGTTVASARASIATCRSMGDRCPLYILKYVHHAAGAKEYPRAVYAAGNTKDAYKPRPISRKESNLRHRAKKKLLVNSVFALALPCDDRRLTTRKRPDASERLRKATAQPVADA